MAAATCTFLSDSLYCPARSILSGVFFILVCTLTVTDWHDGKSKSSKSNQRMGCTPMGNRLGLTAAQVRQLMARQNALPTISAKGARTLELNKNEQEFLEKVLLPDPTVVDIWPHGIRFVLGENDRYEPDFMIMRDTGAIEIFEVKAEWSNGQRGMADSREKVKNTATTFPFPVTIASKRSKKNGGGWHYERFEPTRRHIENRPAPSNTPTIPIPNP